MRVSPTLIRATWIAAVLVLLHMASMLLLSAWISSGMSNAGFGSMVSLLILFILPIIGTLWILQMLGKDFALKPLHWSVIVFLMPLAWFGLQSIRGG